MIERIEEVAARPVPRETFDKLTAYARLLKIESGRQNLISAASIEQLWERHILDSAQLVRFEPFPGASWADVGSGAGLPGIVIACLVAGPVTLIEPRRLRAEFLERVVAELHLKADVIAAKAARATGRFDIITGRAVAPLGEFLKLSAHLSTRKSVWALPKGRGAQSELAEAQRTWQGTFHVEQSVTDHESYIVVATGVRAKAG
jgi:16S rRNA (guanine527-N7)-methyltransferase